MDVLKINDDDDDDRICFILFIGLETMDPMELELRMRMAEVQVKYRLEQKELARLQRLSNELVIILFHSLDGDS